MGEVLTKVMDAVEEIVTRVEASRVDRVVVPLSHCIETEARPTDRFCTKGATSHSSSSQPIIPMCHRVKEILVA